MDLHLIYTESSDSKLSAKLKIKNSSTFSKTCLRQRHKFLIVKANKIHEYNAFRAEFVCSFRR